MTPRCKTPGLLGGVPDGLIPRGADRDTVLCAVIRLPQATEGIERGWST